MAASMTTTTTKRVPRRRLTHQRRLILLAYGKSTSVCIGGGGGSAAVPVCTCGSLGSRVAVWEAVKPTLRESVPASSRNAEPAARAITSAGRCNIIPPHSHQLRQPSHSLPNLGFSDTFRRETLLPIYAFFIVSKNVGIISSRYRKKKSRDCGFVCIHSERQNNLYMQNTVKKKGKE